MLPLDVQGNWTLEKLAKPLVTLADYPEDAQGLTITNSFGVPSRGPRVWVDDMKQALKGVGTGQLLIMSVVGTIKPGFSESDYYDDFATAAREAVEAGAQVIEVNLSCPNVASEGVICYSPDAVEQIVSRTKKAIGDIPLVIKVGYYKPDQQELLENIVARVAPSIVAISAINTLAGEIRDADGNQALPGEGRLRSGVCGAGMTWAGLDMVRRLDALRTENGYSYEIISIRDVMTPNDFWSYRKAGADVVQSVTGAMWNQYLARDIKQSAEE